MKTSKILIIDDNIEIISFVVETLETEDLGYVFYHATNGMKGLIVAEEYLPDLIITDWDMPGISGIKTIICLKENNATKDIPVIMITGAMITKQNLKTAFEAGAIDYIKKPIDPIELAARTKSMLLLSQYYKEIVDIKNRELVSKAMSILQNNEFNQKIIEKINNLEQKLDSKSEKISAELKCIERELSLKIKGESWEHFKNYFQKVHPNFSKNLIAKFPNLTPAELRLATLLRLNLNTKEIASITFLATTSVKTSRNRLRKKMNLSSSDNLTTFILKF